MAEYYYLDSANEQRGPVSKESLKDSVTPATLVWREGLNGWVAASAIDELKDLFRSATPPPTPNVTQIPPVPPVPQAPQVQAIPVPAVPVPPAAPKQAVPVQAVATAAPKQAAPVLAAPKGKKGTDMSSMLIFAWVIALIVLYLGRTFIESFFGLYSPGFAIGYLILVILITLIRFLPVFAIKNTTLKVIAFVLMTLFTIYCLYQDLSWWYYSVWSFL